MLKLFAKYNVMCVVCNTNFAVSLDLFIGGTKCANLSLQLRVIYWWRKSTQNYTFTSVYWCNRWNLQRDSAQQGLREDLSDCKIEHFLQSRKFPWKHRNICEKNTNKYNLSHWPSPYIWVAIVGCRYASQSKLSSALQPNTSLRLQPKVWHTPVSNEKPHT